MADPIERLPTVYARYLQLREQGRTPAEIASALGVPVQSLGLLDVVAREKLAALGRVESGGTSAQG